MNSKKSKNKNRPNKPVNPIPPQKNEEVTPVDKELEQTKETNQGNQGKETIESSPKIEERVPEIISAVVLPVLENEEKNDDTPKKPKRNRGKKNRQNESAVESQESQGEMPIESNKIQVESNVLQTEVVQDILSVEPSARKKKNKGKKTSETVNIMSEKSDELVILEKEQNKIDIVESQSKEQKRLIDDSPCEQEPKPSKKKNKKKKHQSDLEKADKVDEPSCVAAFQQILQGEKESTKVENIALSTLTKEEKHTTTKENKSEPTNVDLSKDIVTADLRDDQSQENISERFKQAFTESGKGKKKNKKDKKTPALEENKEKAVDLTPEIDLKTMSGTCLGQPGFPHDLKDTVVLADSVLKESANLSENILAEDRSKSKARVAKPVEKKRKGKATDDTKEQMSETILQGIEIPLFQDKSQHPTVSKQQGQVKEESIINLKPCQEEVSHTKEIGQIGDPFEIVSSLKEMKLNVAPEEGVLSPPDLEKSRKRKKSPKPKKNLTTEIDQTHAQTCMPANICTEDILIEKEERSKEMDVKDFITKTTPIISKDLKIETESVVLLASGIEKDKKREKSPKPKKYDEISETDETQAQKVVSEIEACSEKNTLQEINLIKAPLTEIDTKSEAKDMFPTKGIKISNKSKKSLKPKDHQQIAETDLTQVQTIVMSEILTENTILEAEVTPEEKKPKEMNEAISQPEITEDSKKDITPESKSKKKGKKSSKFHVEPKTEKSVSDEESSKEKKIEESQLPIDEKTKAFSDTPLSDDIEISSLKADEPEESTYGVTPDIIQYPRATSQDLFDDNNNMMTIQEITFIEETKLQIPVQVPDTPIICGSGETPLITPEIENPSNIYNTNKVNPPHELEKTDLKSKMMEVNQDMEELRLSIEKSLAELTTIERNEEKIEKEFEDKMLFITEDTQSVKLESTISGELITKADIENKDSFLHEEHKRKQLEPRVENVVEIELKDVDKDEKRKPENVIIDSNESSLQIKMSTEPAATLTSPPICPTRKDNKNKGKSKKKGKQENALSIPRESSSTSCPTEYAEQDKTENKKDKTEDQKAEKPKEKGNQQQHTVNDHKDKTPTDQKDIQDELEFEPIEKFEDAMTSSADDINKSFEMIANDSTLVSASHVNPEINIIAPVDDTKQEKRDEKVNPLSQPKNLLGYPDIPVQSNRMDYKKEKNKPPNDILAKVKIKDSIAIEAKKKSKESQTDNIRKFMKNKSTDESFSSVNGNDDFVYKYSFRKVFLQSSCYVCKKELKQARVPCSYCSLIFYCSGKHKDEDWPQHQALCFAVSTIGHLKDQKHIYADAKNVTGQNYRLLRMQMIVSCEKVLKRRLVPWEQEALLYPRICADVSCREWRQSKLVDCEGCAQISFCAAYPDHFPKSHQRWCKSYSLYQKLVHYQQTKGRLEPKLPSKVMLEYQIPDKINEVLASMYEEKIDMSDIQYAALTQIATAPLTAAHCYQIANKYQPHANGTNKKTTCTLHVVDAELQFEADALNKWEVFFLHLIPVDELCVVMVSTHLNTGNLPLELLSRIKLCENCRSNNRKVVFNFQDKQTYYEYWASEDYITPNIVCAFNANISRSSLYNTKNPWVNTINCILKQRVAFLITAHTSNEIHKDVATIKESADHKYDVIVQPKNNNFASVRPDRNFISDDEMPLLFKNYCFALLIGVN